MDETSGVLEMDQVRVLVSGRPLLDIPQLCLQRGEIVAIAGANGAGKSTLLQVAAMLRHPDEGTVRLLGDVVTRRNCQALRRRVGMVFQAPLLFDRDVIANASSGLRFQGVRRRDAESRAFWWLERFGVEHLARRGVQGLSGGEAQRVGLARAFATEPVLLCLDEPFSALDGPTRAELVPELVTHLRESSIAALIVSHDIGECLAVSDRLAVMAEGAIVQIGPGRDVVAQPANEAVARTVRAALPLH